MQISLGEKLYGFVTDVWCLWLVCNFSCDFATPTRSRPPIMFSQDLHHETVRDYASNDDQRPSGRIYSLAPTLTFLNNLSYFYLAYRSVDSTPSVMGRCSDTPLIPYQIPVVHLTKTQPTTLLIYGLRCGFTATL
jgi:hypothetical protein